MDIMIGNHVFLQVEYYGKEKENPDCNLIKTFKA